MTLRTLFPILYAFIGGTGFSFTLVMALDGWSLEMLLELFMGVLFLSLAIVEQTK